MKYQFVARFLSRSAFAGLLALFITGQAASQDAMFVDSSGNVGIGTNTPATALHLLRSDGSAELFIEETSGTAAPRVLYRMFNNGAPILNFVNNNAASNGSWTYTVPDNGAFRINASGSGAPVEMDLFEGGNLSIGGTLSEGSSRAIKQDIVSVDADAVLAKLDTLSIAEWSYNGKSGQRHVGPMAEDFYAVYGLGPDDKHIAPKDLAGVALAAAKALKADNEAKSKRIQQLEARIERLEALVIE